MTKEQEEKFRREVRSAIKALDEGGMSSVQATIAALRAAGAQRHIHEGRKDMIDGSIDVAEWYAGQAIDVLESGAWFAVNSLINCLDKFCPESHS